MRILGYLGSMLAAVIIVILAVILLKGINSGSHAQTGERKAVQQLNSQNGDDDKIDTQGEMKDTIRDALR